MASKSFVRKQSPPSSSPSNANHAVDQSPSVNHPGSSAAASWASVAITKNSAAAPLVESALSNATPASSATASASSSPRLKQKKDEKNAHRQSKSQNSKGHSAASTSSSPTPTHAPTPTLTPATPNSSTPNSSFASSSSLHANAAEPSSSSSSLPSSTAAPASSSAWWQAFPAGLPLGCQVRLQLKNGQECVGVVLSFEDTLKILVVELSSSSASTPSSSSSSSASISVGSDYCMLHFDAIRSVLIVKSECAPIHLPSMKEDELKLKEQKAIEARREAASRIGVNVSADAQRLFNAISKAYPCVWSNDSIIVADVVSIAPPYTNDQVKPLNEGIQQDNLLRFQKILERERQRLKMK